MSAKIITDLSHKLLVAMPQIKDTLFEKSVLYVHEHDDQGAMAFIINKPLPISLSDILRQLNMSAPPLNANEFFLLQGGPISAQQLYISQFNQHNSHESLELIQPQHFLDDFAKGKNIENTLAFLGYSGWEAGQLENELIDNDWLICPFSLEVVTDLSPEQRWEYCMKRIGVDPTHLSKQVGHA